MYTIGQVSAMFNLPVSTLRYYDKEGFFPNLERKGNIRYFSDNELEALRIIPPKLQIPMIPILSWYLKAAPAMKKGKNYLKPENQLLKLKFRNFKKLSPS